MKKRWLRRLSVLLLGVVLLSSLIFSANGSSSVYLMSVNDTVKPEMTADNMPRVVNNVLYIPYTMLSSQVTGVNLGVRAQYSSSRGTLTVTNDVQTVTFDTRRNTAYDAYGNTLEARAVVRNSMVFIPIDWLCKYFSELNYTLSRLPYGTLIRLTNADVILPDVDFVDAADDLLRDNLQRYQSSIATPSPSPTTTVTPSPTPTTTVTPSPSPTVSQEPEPPPQVSLALRWGEQASRVADLLESQKQRALFLFSTEELLVQDDLVRRLVGSGHQIGLVLTGSDVETCLAQLEEGRQLLKDIARCSAVIVSADELSKQERNTLQESGCAVWSSTLKTDGLTANSLLRRLSTSDFNYVEFTCDSNHLDLFSSVLKELVGEEYQLYQAFAPNL